MTSPPSGDAEPPAESGPPLGSAALESGPPLRLRAPADILAAIPYVVGYHPSDSIVVLGLNGPRLTFTARDDIPAPGDTDSVVDRIEYLVGVVSRQDCTGVIIAGFGEAHRVDPLVLGLRMEAERAGLAVREVLRAQCGRYWSYLCTTPSCCPPEGVPYDPIASPIAAEWTLAGRVARRDRAEYEAQVQPVSGPARRSMRLATAVAHERLVGLVARAADEQAATAALRAAGRAAVDTALARQLGGGRLDDDDVAWLSVLLVYIDVRDLAWSRIRGTADVLEQHRALWMDVTRRCEPDLVPAPASLLGFAAWRCGDGGLARLALERALDQDHSYSMAMSLLAAVSLGVPPSVLDGFPRLRVRRRRSRRRPGRRYVGRAGTGRR